MVQRPAVQRQRIGPAIRRLRRKAGMTLDDLAGQAGISASHLSRLERGQTLPSFQVLSDLSHVLGADVDDFVRLQEDVTRIDEEFSGILDAYGFTEDLQHELMGASIELREALFNTFKDLGATPRKQTIRTRAPRRSRSGNAQSSEAQEPATARA